MTHVKQSYDCLAPSSAGGSGELQLWCAVVEKFVTVRVPGSLTQSFQFCTFLCVLLVYYCGGFGFCIAFLFSTVLLGL